MSQIESALGLNGHTPFYLSEKDSFDFEVYVEGVLKQLKKGSPGWFGTEQVRVIGYIFPNKNKYVVGILIKEKSYYINSDSYYGIEYQLNSILKSLTRRTFVVETLVEASSEAEACELAKQNLGKLTAREI